MKADRVITALVMDFDTARGAFELEKLPGWDVASADLRKTLATAEAISGLSPPSLQLWLETARLQVSCWLDVSADTRRGLTPAVGNTLRALSRFARNEIAEPEVKQWGRG